MSIPHFSEMTAPEPVLADVQQEYAELQGAWDEAGDAAGRTAVLRRWNDLRRGIGSWYALTNLRFSQDTRDEEAKAARDRRDALRPKLTDLEVAWKKTLLASPHRAELERAFGGQAFALWQKDVESFDPALEEDLVAESKLEAEYTALLASAKLEFQGETHNLSGLGKFKEDADREVRKASSEVYWGFFRDNAAELDRIYDELTRLRAGMAKKLGLPSFIDLGYLRMSRVDYDQHDVERFRAQVREHLVPLAVDIRKRQGEALGLEPLMSWDEPLHDPQGNPKPQGDHDWMLERAQEMFDALDREGLGAFFELMHGKGLLDLKTREGKAGGGFCTSFPTYGVPFIFANFNGTKGDVRVFTHETGHAFQNYRSQEKPLLDYVWPTSEAAEVHSMSLEFLTWPGMDKFFGEDAERFRKIHLTQSLLFLPYGVAVDHFQHLVHAKPEATPAERKEMWQEMERTYLPWREYGDLPHVGEGGLWQFQRHIYLYPFYYIDYTLALTCALQFWVKAEQDSAAALQAYGALCARGGEAPFRELVTSAGLTPPFEEGCLTDVVAKARAYLGL